LIFTCSVGINFVVIIDKLKHSSGFGSLLGCHYHIDARGDIRGEISRIFVVESKDNV
jgi:hypothetical protein